MLEQCWNHSKQCRNNAVTLCCAKNSRCESSCVTSPLISSRRKQSTFHQKAANHWNFTLQKSNFSSQHRLVRSAEKTEGGEGKVITRVKNLWMCDVWRTNCNGNGQIEDRGHGGEEQISSLSELMLLMLCSLQQGIVVALLGMPGRGCNGNSFLIRRQIFKIITQWVTITPVKSHFRHWQKLYLELET